MSATATKRAKTHRSKYPEWLVEDLCTHHVDGMMCEVEWMLGRFAERVTLARDTHPARYPEGAGAVAFFRLMMEAEQKLAAAMALLPKKQPAA